MKRFRVLLIPVFFVMAFFAFDAVTTDAYAQEGQDSAGVKNDDPEDGPTKTQMWLGLGSIPVMIIVVKFL